MVGLQNYLADLADNGLTIYLQGRSHGGLGFDPTLLALSDTRAIRTKSMKNY